MSQYTETEEELHVRRIATRLKSGEYAVRGDGVVVCSTCGGNCGQCGNTGTLGNVPFVFEQVVNSALGKPMKSSWLGMLKRALRARR